MLFLLTLTGIRLLWITIQTPPEHPSAVNGVLDLRDWDLKGNATINLNGQWEFYPNQFIKQDNPSGNYTPNQYIKVPGKWGAYLSEESNSQLGYGSYRLRVLVTPQIEQSFGLRMTWITNSYELFVNDRLIVQTGQPANHAEQYTPRSTSTTVSFTSDEDELDIVIHVANYTNLKMGGIVRSIQFGDGSAIQSNKWFSNNTQLMVCFLLVIHAIYACILYMIGTRQKVMITFALLLMSTVLLILTDDDRLLSVWFPINFTWMYKLQQLSLISSGALLFKYIMQLLPEYSKIKTFQRLMFFYVIAAIMMLIAPYSFNQQAFFFYFLIILIPSLIIPTLTLRSAMKGDRDVLFLLLGVTAITTNALWGFIKNTIWTELSFYPLDFIIAFLALAAYWFKQYFRSSVQTQKLAEKLQKADKLKDDFLANTSHELRNPLHGIINIAQSVLDTGKNTLGDINTKNLEVLVSVGKRMSFLINDLLELNQLQESGIVLQTSPTRIQTLASGVFDMLRFMTEGKPIRLINHVPDNFPSVIADENRLIQIIFNLLHNAVKFTNEGTITINASVKNGVANIMIIDTGIGMDEETLKRVFQRYEQGDSSMTAIGGGLGLGLSISKQLIELHGGEIQVISTPGQGSVTTFTMPFASVSKEDNVTPELTVLSSLVALNIEASASSESDLLDASLESIIEDKVSILAVDDDPVNLNILVNILYQEHYDIVTVTSAKDALSILNTREWDLVISDVMMPHMSGYELTQAIRESFSISELPILLLTARSRAEDIEVGFQSGANDYVSKPMDALELRTRVRALTNLKQSVRERMRMEGAWLQAQIQPHFLFNTLTAVAALSEIDTVRTRKLLEVFGNYLRASFDFKNADKLVTLKHELELVHSYVYIEKERFEDRLQVTWELDESIPLFIPPLSIQPLVENAVKHGIMKRSRGGEIVIRVIDHDDYAEISVSDDGVGMDEVKLKHILDMQPGKRTGIGLLNTDRRLKQMYGKGLQIDSTLGQGTTVSFRVLRRKK